MISSGGALSVGLRHSEALGGVSRFTFQMDNAHLPQEKLLHSIELIGTKVIPLVAGSQK